VKLGMCSEYKEHDCFDVHSKSVLYIFQIKVNSNIYKAVLKTSDSGVQVFLLLCPCAQQLWYIESLRLPQNPVDSCPAPGHNNLDTSIIFRFTRFLDFVHHIILGNEYVVQELGLFPSSEDWGSNTFSAECVGKNCSESFSSICELITVMDAHVMMFMSV
jgi:hypothetical protein